MTPRAGTKIRVLLLAEACNPRWKSVPLVGYNQVRALVERPDLEATLVTQVRNKESLDADPISSLAPIVYVDTELVARPFFRLSRMIRGGVVLSWTINTAFAWPGYMTFERLVYRRFFQRRRSNEFDIIHRVTPVSPTLGSPLAGLANVPMVIGPLNGGLPWPKEYPELRSREREWMVPLRPLYKRLPYYRSTYRRLAAVIAGSRHTASEIPSYFAGRRYYLPENGIVPGLFGESVDLTSRSPRFRFVTVGRLVPYKGMDLVLEAMGRSPQLRECELTVVGDGPSRSALESLARDTGLSANVRFLGNIEQRELGRELSAAHAFVFPSLREFGGAVVLEAMAAGLPSIVVDYGGPGELVTDDSGIKLPMAPRDQLVPALTTAMETLASDPVLCRRLGHEARQRAIGEFSWSAKAERIATIYREILGR